MRIFLLGFMGCGKSSTGTELAHLMDFEFLDLDEMIEQRAQMSVEEIFAGHGETYFRSIESELLRETVRTDNVVVATGGGAPVRSGNLDLMQRYGLTVWLDIPLAVSNARLSLSDQHARPLFGELKSNLELYNQRLPVYQSANVRLELAGDETPAEIAQEIFHRVSSPA